MRRPVTATPRNSPGVAVKALALAGLTLLGTVLGAPRPWAQAGGQAGAQTGVDTDRASRELKRIEDDIAGGKSSKARLERLARDLGAEIERLRGEMTDAATRQQRTEETVAEVEGSLATLRQEAAEKRGVLAGRQHELGRLVGALQRLTLRPPATLLLMGRPPLETVRTGILLESAIPEINAEAQRLKAELAGLASVEAGIREQKARLDQATAELDRERQRLAALADEKSKLLSATETRAAGTAERLQGLAESARSLRELLAGLEAQRARERAEQDRLTAMVRPPSTDAPPPATADAAQVPSDSTQAGAASAVPLPVERPDRAAPGSPTAPAASKATGQVLAMLPAAPPITTAKGRLLRPVAGSIVHGFGQADPEGLRNRGIVFATREGATVVAPYDGSVIYAGRFEGFGLILIIEHGQGYLTLLAGLGRIGLQVGHRVLAGEPVGTMPTRQSEGSGGRRPELYVELRHNGDPIDPLPWIAGLTGKARG